MHITVIIEDPGGTKGPDTQANNLLKALDRHASSIDEITVLCKIGSTPRYQSPSIIVRDVLNPYRPIISAHNLRKICKDSDIVHLFAADWRIVVAALLLVPTPVIVGPSTQFRAKLHQLIHSIRRPTSVFNSVTPFETALEDFGYPQSNTFFIPNGIDTEIFKPVNFQQQMDIREELISKHNISPKENVVVWVNHLNEHKRPFLAIQAFRTLKERRDNVSLLMVGNGPLSNSVQEEINQSEDIHLLGFVEHDRIHKYYKASDVGLLTSRSEGISNVVFETMACGIPVVTSTPFDQVGEGEFGRYLPPSASPVNIADGLEKVLECRDELGTLAREHVYSSHGLPTFAERYCRLYAWRLNQGPKPDFLQEWKEDTLNRVHR